MTEARVALYISLASFAVSVLGLLWQRRSFRLSGARLVVELRPCLLGDNGDLVTFTSGKWHRKRPLDINRDLGHTVELAAITVTNVGRIATSAREIYLDFGAPQRWRPWARSTASLRPVTLKGGLDTTEVRLQPGELATVYMPPFGFAHYEAQRLKRTIRVRATARIAGHHPQRTPWRQGWKVTQHQAAMDRSARPTPQLVAYRTLFDACRKGEEDLLEFWHAWTVIDKHLSTDDPHAAMSAVVADPAIGPHYVMAAASAVGAYRKALQAAGPQQAAEPEPDFI